MFLIIKIEIVARKINLQFRSRDLTNGKGRQVSKKKKKNKE